MNVGIIGAGTMGIGIAHALVSSGSNAWLVEPQVGQLEIATAGIEAVLASGVSRGKLSELAKTAAMERLRTFRDIGELPIGLDWIIEAVTESLDVKAEVLRRAEDRKPLRLASNTSALSITRLAESLSHPENFLGTHFFNPVWSMKLLEIVVGSLTSPQAVSDAEVLGRLLNKETIVVKDSPGFASSRLGVLLGIEAIRMLQEKIASAEDIDRAMVYGYGYPMGPLRLGDLVGLDIRLSVAQSLAEAYGDRFSPPQLLIDMVGANKLGKKTGEGFYRW